jgi:D-3-phosphoglycerate dehydrogenase / 2-oxoglutarate reductase
MAQRVVVTDHVFGGLDIEHSLLDPLGVELVKASATDERTLIDLARGASGLLVCYAKVTEPIVRVAAESGCQVIARYGIGYDNVDVEAASHHGIVVTNVPDYCVGEVADHAMALLLALARGVVDAVEGVHAGGWSVPRAEVHRLQGRRLALVGVGRIGRAVVGRAQAFSLDVVGFDPFLEDWDVAGLSRAHSLEEALAEAHFVSLHAPLTPENHHLICDRTIAFMHRAPIVVNTARGGLVDLEAICRALDDGRVGGVGLDVTEVEPLPRDHPLRSHPRALITPHMAFYSVEAQAELQRRAAEEVARILRGEPPRCPVNAPAYA